MRVWQLLEGRWKLLGFASIQTSDICKVGRSGTYLAGGGDDGGGDAGGGETGGGLKFCVNEPASPGEPDDPDDLHGSLIMTRLDCLWPERPVVHRAWLERWWAARPYDDCLACLQ